MLTQYFGLLAALTAGIVCSLLIIVILRFMNKDNRNLCAEAEIVPNDALTQKRLVEVSIRAMYMIFIPLVLLMAPWLKQAGFTAIMGIVLFFVILAFGTVYFYKEMGIRGPEKNEP